MLAPPALLCAVYPFLVAEVLHAPWWYGQVSSCVWKDQLYVTTGKLPEVQGTPFLHGATVFRGTIKLQRKLIPSPAHHHNFHGWGTAIEGSAKVHIKNDNLLHWHLSDGMHTMIFPLDELVCFEQSHHGQLQAKSRHRTQFTENHETWRLSNMVDITVRFTVKDAWWFQPPPWFGRKSDFEYDFTLAPGDPHWLHADVLLDNPGSVRVFNASKTHLYMSIEPDLLPLEGQSRKRRGEEKPPPRDLHVGKLPSNFKGLFTVSESGGRYYLCTTRGHVFEVTPRPKGELLIEQVYDGTDRPIIGTVQDPDNRKTYGFGRNSDIPGSTDRFFIEYCPQPKRIPYQFTQAVEKDSEESYREAYECVRAFRGAVVPKK